MELRGCSHLHYISTIKGGEVTKIPNISRERKVLKLKNLSEIIFSECHNFVAKSPPKVDRSLDTPYGDDETSIKIKNEPMEGSELDFCAMTLKQLQDTCKSKKRKKLQYVSTAVKQECDSLQLQQDESDLKETLGSWKRKLHNKKKAKRTKNAKCASVSAEANSFRDTSKDILSNLALHASSEEFFRPVKIKVEDAETGYLQPDTSSGVLVDNPEYVTCEVLGSTGCSSTEQVMETTLVDLQSSCLSGTSALIDKQISKPVETQSCCLNQVFYEVEENNRSPSPVSQEHIEYIQLKTILISEDPKIDNITDLDDTAVVSGHFSELRMVENMNDLMTIDKASEVMVPQCESSNAHQLQPCIGKLVEAQHLGTGDTNSCQNVGFIDHGESIGSTDVDDNLEAKVIGMVDDGSLMVTSGSDSSLLLANDVAPMDALPSAIEDKQLWILNASVTSLDCSPDNQPNEGIDEGTESAASESCQDKEVIHPPERLLSARKTISPISQRRLCRAMSSVGLQNMIDGTYCKEKMAFEKDEEDKSSSAWVDIKGDQNILRRPEDKAAITTNSRQSTRKAKDERKGLRFKANVKGSRASHISQQEANDSSPVHNCSRSAIKFSQQQMRDTERLAMKLMTDLQSMKEIVVDALHCESRAGLKLRYSTDEVRIAVENATKAEETARKWLSMMTRDCTRFCKIMTLAGANAASPEATSPDKKGQKERKKIIFADEAGGSLCQVRVFEALEADMGIMSPAEYPVTE